MGFRLPHPLGQQHGQDKEYDLFVSALDRFATDPAVDVSALLFPSADSLFNANP